MVVLKYRVKCYFCGQEVDKLTARQLEADRKEPRYQCFSCFKKNLGSKAKQTLYCERCNYRFSSRNSVCPYCNQRDRVSSGSFNAVEYFR